MAGRRTPAIVVAERAGIWFAVHEYHHDPGTSSYGLEAARELGVDAARAFKTLIVDSTAPSPSLSFPSTRSWSSRRRICSP